MPRIKKAVTNLNYAPEESNNVCRNSVYLFYNLILPLFNCLFNFYFERNINVFICSTVQSGESILIIHDSFLIFKCVQMSFALDAKMIKKGRVTYNIYKV